MKRFGRARSQLACCRHLAALALPPLLASCVTLTELPRALTYDESAVKVQSLRCADVARAMATPVASPAVSGLDPQRIRLFTWNLHKEGDEGWQQDLATFVANHDVVLLQEATLQPALRQVIENAKLRWVMASSFIYKDRDIGVLTAARIAPTAACTERVAEPLIVIPKSSVITWYSLAGRRDRLAVANIHAINFSLSLGAYHAQMDAVAEALKDHRGPVVVAGDLNTWTDARVTAVRELAERLGLTEISFENDKRTLFFGKQLDHILVRGLAALSSSAFPVTSSDHNPVAATLRIAP